ncbi:MAG: lipoate--protein ligase family protein [Gammaproteobacteria bacterium]|nr:lipoate--protein ligase family protein [Gammaproteobacteria bacterium]
MRDQKRWRLLDTGLRSAAENMALNKTLLELHQEGFIPNTLRFLQFPPSALIGFHQSVEQELREDYCKENGIEIQRRITGGGAIYFDQTQIGWELYLDKQTLGTADMGEIAKKICTAAAKGISALGVNAEFRPRNDIEVDGKKISGTGGAFDGNSILYQGTLLVDFDVERMLRVLKIPAEKLNDKMIESARERVANLKDLLGEAPALDKVKSEMMKAFAKELDLEFFVADELSEVEKRRFAENLTDIDTSEWVYLNQKPASASVNMDGISKTAGGLMRVTVGLDTERNHIKQLWITGDFFVNPRRMIIDLEAALKDTPVADLRVNVNRFFDNYPVEMLMLSRADFIAAIESALQLETLEESVG